MDFVNPASFQGVEVSGDVPVCDWIIFPPGVGKLGIAEREPRGYGRARRLDYELLV